MKLEEAWSREERLWLEGADAYGELLDPHCVMAFSAPVGLMRGGQIAASLDGAPRWESVAMSERISGRADSGTVVLGYRAEGRRPGSDPYHAFCTSTYRLAGGAWKLVQHQQTPIG